VGNYDSVRMGIVLHWNNSW